MWDRWNTPRRGGARRLLDHPPLKADVRPDLDIEAAADVLTVLNNPELHYVYVTRGHWEESTFEAWLADAMHRLILTPAGP